MATHSSARINDLIKSLAMEYLSRESNRTSLVTVTEVKMADKNSKALILFTVLPESKEHAVLDFAKRKRPEFREYIKDRARLRVIPFIDFDIDFGERNRQRVDQLTINDSSLNSTEEKEKIDEESAS
jgi:ribosome-binding factor A